MVDSVTRKRRIKRTFILGVSIPITLCIVAYYNAGHPGWRTVLDIVESVVFGSWLVLFGVVWLYAKAAAYPERYLPHIEQRLAEEAKLPSTTAAQVKANREKLNREMQKIDTAKLDQEAAEYMLAALAALAGAVKVVAFLV